MVAIGNSKVQGIELSLTDSPEWIWLEDNYIYSTPSDNDQGIATINVIAKDTGSTAQAETTFIAEARLRPIISNITITPSSCEVTQGETATATIAATANSAVTGISYEIDDSPSWITNTDDIIYMSPKGNDLGSVTTTVIAKDTGSSARAETIFSATAIASIEPEITGITANPTTVTMYHYSPPATVTLTAEHNEAATGITYSVDLPEHLLATVEGATISFLPTHDPEYNITKTATITAHDETGRASYSTEYNVYLAKEQTILTLNPSQLSLGTKGSGYATITTNLWASSYNEGNNVLFYFEGKTVKNATVTGGRTGTNTGTISIRYSRAYAAAATQSTAWAAHIEVGTYGTKFYEPSPRVSLYVTSINTEANSKQTVNRTTIY